MWWYSRARRPGVDLDSLADPYVDDLRDEYADLRRGVAVLDVTNDLGIPTFVGVSWRDDGGPEQIAFGFGTHLDTRVAILRSLTELNQIVATLGTGVDGSSGEDVTADDRELLTWLRSATLADQPHLVPTGEPGTSATIPRSPATTSPPTSAGARRSSPPRASSSSSSIRHGPTSGCRSPG